jgi:chromosome segregation ATPase
MKINLLLKNWARNQELEELYARMAATLAAHRDSVEKLMAQITDLQAANAVLGETCESQSAEIRQSTSLITELHATRTRLKGQLAEARAMQANAVAVDALTKEVEILRARLELKEVRDTPPWRRGGR